MAEGGRGGDEEQTPEGLLRQMMGNPQMVSEQLASPWRQSMLQYIQQNPQLMEQVCLYNTKHTLLVPMPFSSLFTRTADFLWIR